MNPSTQPSTTARSTCWSLTINNPTGDDEEQINLARQKGWKVEGQLEKGSEGTPHYQLRVMTPQIRFSAMKKAFPRAHIEAARDSIALGRYVTKEETRVSGLPTGQDRYPSLSKLWELIYQHYNTQDKYGWDILSLEEDAPSFYNEQADARLTKTPLVVFDEAVRALIIEGYHVESIAANPSTRSMWKLYARELIARSHRQEAERALQTDRQTDSVRSSEEVIVPMHITDVRQVHEAHECPSPQSCGWHGPPPPPPPPAG